MKNRTTKEKLLIILKKNEAITIDKMKESLTISEPAIRKHLQDLERQGFIDKKAHKQEIGRPFHTYELTEKGHGVFPNQYEQLPVELLQDLEELKGSDAVKALLEKRMEREEGRLTEVMEGSDFEEKVKKLIEVQNKSGYMIEFSRDEEGNYILTNYNCPIANIAHEYVQVCSNEKVMYNHLFAETEVIPEAYITNGSHVCKWIIKAPAKYS